MLPHPDIGDTTLDRQIFTYVEQLEDPVRPRTPGAKAKPNIGDDAVHRHLLTYLLQKQLQDTLENKDFQDTQENYRYPGHIGELGYPGHTGDLGLPGHTGELGYPGQISPTTYQTVQLQSKIYSPAGSINTATGDMEQLECQYRGELDYPASTSEAALYSPEDPLFTDSSSQICCISS